MAHKWTGVLATALAVLISIPTAPILIQAYERWAGAGRLVLVPTAGWEVHTLGPSPPADVDNKLVDELPLVVGGTLRSSFTLPTTLTPKATKVGSDDGFLLGGGQAAAYATNLDGASANTTSALSWNWIAVNAPTLEAITDVTVDTNGFKAEFGGANTMSFQSRLAPFEAIRIDPPVRGGGRVYPTTAQDRFAVYSDADLAANHSFASGLFGGGFGGGFSGWEVEGSWGGPYMPRPNWGDVPHVQTATLTAEARVSPTALQYSFNAQRGWWSLDLQNRTITEGTHIAVTFQSARSRRTTAFVLKAQTTALGNSVAQVYLNKPGTLTISSTSLAAAHPSVHQLGWAGLLAKSREMSFAKAELAVFIICELLPVTIWLLTICLLEVVAYWALRKLPRMLRRRIQHQLDTVFAAAKWVGVGCYALWTAKDALVGMGLMLAK